MLNFKINKIYNIIPRNIRGTELQSVLFPHVFPPFFTLFPLQSTKKGKKKTLVPISNQTLMGEEI